MTLRGKNTLMMSENRETSVGKTKNLIVCWLHQMDYGIKDEMGGVRSKQGDSEVWYQNLKGKYVGT
jgi:hypothetical protein